MLEVILCDRLLCGVESGKEIKRLSTTMSVGVWEEGTITEQKRNMLNDTRSGALVSCLVFCFFLLLLWVAKSLVQTYIKTHPHTTDPHGPVSPPSQPQTTRQTLSSPPLLFSFHPLPLLSLHRCYSPTPLRPTLSVYPTLVMPMRALVLLGDEVLVVGALCSVLVRDAGVDLQAQPEEHHAVWVC